MVVDVIDGEPLNFSQSFSCPDCGISLDEIEVLGWQSANSAGSFTNAILKGLAEHYNFSLDTPFKDYSQKVHDILIYGTKGEEVGFTIKACGAKAFIMSPLKGLSGIWNGVTGRPALKLPVRSMKNFMMITPCGECGGKRLKRESLAVTVSDKNIAEITELSIVELRGFYESSGTQRAAEADRRTDF